MGYLAQWGPKGFIVSPNKIVPLKDFSTSVSLKADSENDTSGTDPTNTRGLEPQPINLSTTYLRSAGVDPRTQIDEWFTLVGVAHPLLIAGKRFGPPKVQLTQVSVSGLEFTNSGDILKADVSISLTEYADKKTSVQSKAKAATKSSKLASAYEAAVAAKSQAMSATASGGDKAAKKPSATSWVVMET